MHAGVNPLTLTAMDSGFMFTYAGGSFITGQLGDRFSPVVVVGLGLLGSTLCLLLIVFGASTSIISNVALCGTWFLTCQLLHGAFQATGGPVSFLIIHVLFLNADLYHVNLGQHGHYGQLVSGKRKRLNIRYCQ
jgi:OPA family glycerol-3-phosphate transporter-like MFS transporter 1/2